MTAPANTVRNKTRTRRCVEYVFLLAGVAGIGIWAGSLVRESIHQTQDSREFDRRKASYAHAEMPARIQTPIADNTIVGRIRIPRLNLSAMVRQGTGDRTLDIAVGHIPGTAFPGDPGNVAVAAHRDTLFRGLRNIRQDDLIEFETERGAYSYRVESTRIVKPEDVSVLNAGVNPELTLVTCYPFNFIGSAPDRFIVKARQLLPQEAALQVSAAPDPESPVTPARHVRRRVVARSHTPPPIQVTAIADSFQAAPAQLAPIEHRHPHRFGTRFVANTFGRLKHTLIPKRDHDDSSASEAAIP